MKPMFKTLRTFFRHYRQIAVIASLLFSTGVCLTLLAFRIARASSFQHTHLVWNLFLAWLPMLAALVAYNLAKRPTPLTAFFVLPCAVFWLLFLPNAPYLITDIMHLQPHPIVPLWYDILLLVAFAWTGCFLGLVSLYLMQLLVQRALGTLVSWGFALSVMGISGFGIYLGRFLRWNSWDVFSQPLSILRDVADRLLHPLAHFHTFAFSLLFSAFFLSAYFMVVALTQFAPEPAKSQ